MPLPDGSRLIANIPAQNGLRSTFAEVTLLPWRACDSTAVPLYARTTRNLGNKVKNLYTSLNGKLMPSKTILEKFPDFGHND